MHDGFAPIKSMMNNGRAWDIVYVVLTIQFVQVAHFYYLTTQLFVAPALHRGHGPLKFGTMLSNLTHSNFLNTL